MVCPFLGGSQLRKRILLVFLTFIIFVNVCNYKAYADPVVTGIAVAATKGAITCSGLLLWGGVALGGAALVYGGYKLYQHLSAKNKINKDGTVKMTSDVRDEIDDFVRNKLKKEENSTVEFQNKFSTGVIPIGNLEASNYVNCTFKPSIPHINFPLNVNGVSKVEFYIKYITNSEYLKREFVCVVLPNGLGKENINVVFKFDEVAIKNGSEIKCWWEADGTTYKLNGLGIESTNDRFYTTPIGMDIEIRYIYSNEIKNVKIPENATTTWNKEKLVIDKTYEPTTDNVKKIIDNPTVPRPEEIIKTPVDPGTNPNPNPNPNPNINVDLKLDLEVPKEVNIDFSPLYVSFADKFPFCIPFDIYESVKSFKTNPIPPTFTIPFSEAFKGGTDIEIDFGIFKPLFSIVRYCFLVTFMFWLFTKTRDIIKG